MYKYKVIDDELMPYQLLANEVVRQAADDYREYKMAMLLVKSKDSPAYYEIYRELLKIRQFFMSGWFAQLTEVNGKYIIERLEKECYEAMQEPSKRANREKIFCARCLAERYERKRRRK